MSRIYMDELICQNVLTVDTDAIKNSTVPIANKSVYELANGLGVFQGCVIETGSFTMTSAKSATKVSISFFKNFTNTPLVMVSSEKNPSNYRQNCFNPLNIYNVSSNGFDVYAPAYTDGSYTITHTVKWVAIGI